MKRIIIEWEVSEVEQQNKTYFRVEHEKGSPVPSNYEVMGVLRFFHRYLEYQETVKCAKSQIDFPSVPEKKRKKK